MRQQLHLSLTLVQDLLLDVCREGMAEELLTTSQTSSHYRITDRGREYASRSLEVCGYVGPAPVRLEAYAAMLRWQFANSPQVLPEHVAAALSGLVVTPKAAQLAGLAVSSGRSLFVYGPPGNGKSSLGRQIHGGLAGRLLDSLRHQRGQHRDPGVRRPEPPARPPSRPSGPGPSISAGCESAGRWSSSAAN